MIQLKNKDINKIIVIGDKVLLRPSKPLEKLDSGLYLPQGVHKKEELYSGYVIRVGPGYPMPSMGDVEESWKSKNNEVKYLPIQPLPGDLAVYIQQNVFPITFNGEEYVIAPQSAILMLIRENDEEDDL